ncbi:MAG: M24 family metallopeptidase [Methanomicrobiales archaeon]
MDRRIPATELHSRMERVRDRMDRDHPDWEMAAIFGNINQYYLTGTMQDGVLVIPRNGEAEFWVRRSYERARDESLFPVIRPMKSFRDIQHSPPASLHVETSLLPVGLLDAFRKHMPFQDVASMDMSVAAVRAVKSPFEISIMKEAGEIHRRVFEDEVLGMLREGMSEARLATDLFSRLVECGHQGIVRFGAFGTEIIGGHLGFGESSLYPTMLDSPSGCRGIGPAAPVLGSSERMLERGDLVYIDYGCGVRGYQTDKTMTYVFGGSPPGEAVAAQRTCEEIQQTAAALLRPGAIPSEIYTAVMADLDEVFLENFMGFGDRRVGFLGHGVGLQVDEMPVIARGFDEPLAEGMAIAIEPKKGIAGFGLVGIENTFLVTPGGGRSITGNRPGLIPVE